MPGELFGQPDDSYVPVQFGRPWQMTGALTLTQRIYDEAMFRGIPAISAGRSVSDLLVARTEEEILFNTATVFYQTFQTEQLLRALDANAEKLDALQRMAELQLANDYAIPTDIIRTTSCSSAASARTTGRLIRRKSPASSGISKPIIFRMRR